MAAHGAALQNHNNELVKCLEDLRDKREEINKQVRRVCPSRVSIVVHRT